MTSMIAGYFLWFASKFYITTSRYIPALSFSHVSLGGRRSARPFRLPFFHLERVYVLCDTCDLQRTLPVSNEVEEEQDLLCKWIAWEVEGDVGLSRRS